MRRKQRYLIFWMVVGALIGVVAMVLIERAGIPNFVGGGVIGMLGGAVYQLGRYGW